MGNEMLNTGEEQLMLYTEHSKAIFQFSLLEGLLASMVTLWVSEETGKVLFNSFYGIDSFRSKLEFLDRYVLNHIGDKEDEVKAWKFALDKCKSVAQERNKLAHWYMQIYGEEEPGRRVVMVPPAFNPGDSLSLDGKKAGEGKLPGYALTIHGIVSITNKITDAWMYVFKVKCMVLGTVDTTEDMHLPTKTPRFEVLLKSFRGVNDAFLKRPKIRPPSKHATAESKPADAAPEEPKS